MDDNNFKKITSFVLVCLMISGILTHWSIADSHRKLDDRLNEIDRSLFEVIPKIERVENSTRSIESLIDNEE